jgi:hypothetical protein
MQDTEGETWKGRAPTIDIIRPEIYKSLTNEAEEKNTSLRKYANEIFESHLDKSKFLSTYMPKFKMIAFEDNIMFIRDKKVNQTAEISYKDGLIYCNLCKKTLCFHVMYSMGLPEIARLQPNKK